MLSLKAGLLYFATVFAAGFVLGTVRVLWLVPRVGVRSAELLESPLMLAVTIVAARWTVKRMSVPAAPRVRVAMGGIALACILIADFGPVLWLRGLGLRESFAARDPVSGTVYYCLLLLFGAMPWLIMRR